MSNPTNNLANNYVKLVQAQIQEAKNRLSQAEDLSARLKKAGQSTLDIDSQITNLKQQLLRLEEAFSN